MQAVPTLELLPMDDLLTICPSDDIENLNMYLSNCDQYGNFVKHEKSCLSRNLMTSNGGSDDTRRKPYSEVQFSMKSIDDEKRQRRRFQNRVAARKFREKKKAHAENIVQDYRRLQTENSRLQDDIERLRRQKNRLEEIVEQHVSSCVFHSQGQHVFHSDIQQAEVKHLPVDDINCLTATFSEPVTTSTTPQLSDFLDNESYNCLDTDRSLFDMVTPNCGNELYDMHSFLSQ